MTLLRVAAKRPTNSARSLLAAVLATILAVGPVSPAFAQNPAQDKPADAAATPQSTTIPPVGSLGLAKHNFTKGPSAFPSIAKPYSPIQLEEPNLVNAPRIDQLIHDGKLELTLQDAIELALENNLEIVVSRYNPWIADTDVLRTLGGGAGRGLAGTGTASVLGSIPSLNFDPQITSTISFDDRSTPVNNPFLSGSGLRSLTGLVSHTSTYNTQYSQGFHTGTGFFTTWDNTRLSSDAANIFNPSVQSSLYVGFSQQLLNGFGLLPNTRNILIAKNSRKIADWQFTQQAVTTITNTINTYWELVYARENVKVQQQAVTVAEKLSNDNRKQLEIGTMAPLDVTRAESELATDHQNMIVAQTAQLQQEQVLKNAISKNPLASNLVNVQIIPIDLPNRPEIFEAPNFEEATKEAFAKRPDLQQELLALQNGEIEVKATRNALLPTATLYAQYGSVGLAGNQPIPGTTVFSSSGVPVVHGDGTFVPNEFIPTSTTPSMGVTKAGFGDAMSQVFHNQFPDYSVQLSVTVPIRNRQAQADNQRAILSQRQLEAQMQQLKNSALLEVRITYIALVQGRARVDAARKARELQQQTFEAEQKKYQLGASTVYNVILTQRDFITAQGNELRALVDLVEAKANYERAVGRTLETNRVTVANAKSGDVPHETLIPGTVNGQVIGSDKIFEPSGQR